MSKNILPDLELPKLYALRENLNRLIYKTIPNIPPEWLDLNDFERETACGTYRCLAGWDYKLKTGKDWYGQDWEGSWKWKRGWLYSVGTTQGGNIIASHPILGDLFGAIGHGDLEAREAYAKRLLKECEAQITEKECARELTT